MRLSTSIVSRGMGSLRKFSGCPNSAMARDHLTEMLNAAQELPLSNKKESQGHWANKAELVANDPVTNAHWYFRPDSLDAPIHCSWRVTRGMVAEFFLNKYQQLCDYSSPQDRKIIAVGGQLVPETPKTPDEITGVDLGYKLIPGSTYASRNSISHQLVSPDIPQLQYFSESDQDVLLKGQSAKIGFYFLGVRSMSNLPFTKVDLGNIPSSLLGFIQEKGSGYYFNSVESGPKYYVSKNGKVFATGEVDLNGAYYYRNLDSFSADWSGNDPKSYVVLIYSRNSGELDMSIRPEVGELLSSDFMCTLVYTLEDFESLTSQEKNNLVTHRCRGIPSQTCLL